MKKIIFLTDKHFFGQTRKPWVSMDTNKIISILQNKGFIVESYSFHEVYDRNIENCYIFYSFSQKEELRNYIIDVIYFLRNKNTVIPSFELLKCHENKGFQELYKKQLGINSLDSIYLNSIDNVKNDAFPIVLKTVDGSNGKGVFLVNNNKELKKIVQKVEQNVTALQKIDLLRRKYFRKKKNYPAYPNYNNRTDYYQYKDYIRNDKRFVLQKFIPKLTFDYRVLALYDKYYIMKRHTKEGDFRASGTKLFDFNIKENQELLTYAKNIFDRIKAPMLSMDIAFNGDQYYLIEFQASHFGVSALIKSKGYYSLINNKWELISATSNLETEIAESIIKFINSNWS